MNAPESPSRPRRRRWFQYSLRTLLLVVTVAAVLLGIWTGRARRQKEAVEAIRELGGYVGYSSADGDAPGPDWLAEVAGNRLLRPRRLRLCRRRWVHRRRPGATPSLRGLKTLALLGPNITDAGLEHVGRLGDLEMLSLGGPGITDAGFAHLKHLRKLTRLTIERGAVVDGDRPPAALATGPDATRREAPVDPNVMMRGSCGVRSVNENESTATPR